MKIVAHRGNNLNAPENTLTSLISAYTSGSDVLEFDIQLSKDHELVISHDESINRLCGLDGNPINIYDKTLQELRWGSYDFSDSFNPSQIADYSYYKSNKRQQIEVFHDIIDRLPKDIEKLIELKHDSSDSDIKRKTLVKTFAKQINDRSLQKDLIIYSKDYFSLRLLKELVPDIRIAVFNWELSDSDLIKLILSERAEGIVIALDRILYNGQFTELADNLRQLYSESNLKLGAIVYPYRKPGVFSKEEFDQLSKEEFIWSISTDTTLQAQLIGSNIDISELVYPSYTWFKDNLQSSQVDRDWIALGYAKANEYCYVHQNEAGVNIQLEPYNGFMPLPSHADPIENRVQKLELRLLYAERNWPFYSGGGLGIVRPIEGDFIAVVDYRTEKLLTQAQTLEMAVTNVDPARHRSTKPTSFRHADAFYDPHGCPPYVGVEHDEDDGYRINWNLGADYDNNQYGPPVGNGKLPMSGTLRLERKNNYFSAYYKNNHDAPEWVCVGVVKNDSLNSGIYLRCVAKRWLQERSDAPDGYHPVNDNTITFKNIHITKPLNQINNNEF